MYYLRLPCSARFSNGDFRHCGELTISAHHRDLPTLPVATPFTVICHIFTLMVAFDGSAETALNVLSVALSGSKETVRVVVFPFATVPDVGVTLIAVAA